MFENDHVSIIYFSTAFLKTALHFLLTGGSYQNRKEFLGLKLNGVLVR